LILGIKKERTASIDFGVIDNNGDENLLAANGSHWPGKNRVFLNNGDGLFTISRPLDSQSDTIYSTDLADFDYSYIKYELKNGETISYEFGDAKADDVDGMSKEFFDLIDTISFLI